MHDCKEKEFGGKSLKYALRSTAILVINILRLIGVLPNILFTTSETKRDYY